MCTHIGIGEPGGARTRDPRLKRPVLYQLSYRPTTMVRYDGASHHTGKPS